ncbi:MAG: tRNA pseudouridine(54/55) synthase Pus10 [Planctomycetota bacterium]|nr:tRNA pseudouridine(54/55) synthase Pus10 [Planctomycetota bacterium]MEC8252056.1 tRNA pseudouridine(54/55) synthase Pus10 [Planctomycetota bacterium]MEC8651574.1 tRNA pseudouridine(54/55) synthase Pus10 [Planctomycetota bacterium]
MQTGSARPRSTLYLESRYRKLRRGLPQTIFFCPKCKGDRRRRRGCEACEGFGKLTKDSVQELIGRRVIPQMQAKTGKFHGAGREDIDVLMLGLGRPFVFEVVGAKNPNLDLEALRLDIVERAEGAIELAPFERVDRKRVVYWKETHFDKVYRAEVAVASTPADEALASVQAFAGGILQRTPQRVAHRRADLERERRLRVLSLEPRDDGALELRVVCQHGTYVKEWISGDEERTSPSLATLLGVGCRCAVLDVEEILTPGVSGPSLEG